MAPTTENTENAADAAERAPGTVPSLEVERYTAYLNDSDLGPEEAQEFLEALWNIMVAFVDLGFGAAPSQNIVAYFSEELAKTSEGGIMRKEDEKT